MNGETAWRLFNEGQQVNLLIDGKRVDGVMVTGLNISSSGSDRIKLLLPTRIGERDKRVELALDRVELADS